jgi:hypothetical protein
MTYSGSVVLEKIFKWPHPIFEFCDYFLFEEDPALYLNNLKLTLPKDDLYQVWLKWPAGSGEDFFQYKHNNYVHMAFPIVAPPDPRGAWCEQFWIYIISESFHVNMTYFGSVVLEKRILNDPTPFLHFCDYLQFEEDLTLYLNNLELSLHKDDLCQVWIFTFADVLSLCNTTKKNDIQFSMKWSLSRAYRPVDVTIQARQSSSF